jgi:cytochrome c peroxidase
MNIRNLVTLVAVLASVGGCAVEIGDAGDEGDPEESAESSDLDVVIARHADHHNRLPNHVPIFDATGVFTTVSARGFIDLDNEFFQDLGTNDRRCVSCHVPTVGWTITPHELRTVFNFTDGGKFDDGFGLGAVFRTVDGANSPNADVSTLAKRRQAYSLLLNRGLIRIGLPMPANAEFELVAVDDPYHFASARELSLFRRPLPVANLKFDSTVMWDGREVVAGQTIAFDLANQANTANLIHAQGKPLTQTQRESIVNFTVALASAQIFDRKAKDLHAAGAKGGPDEILKQEFHIGINDNFGDPVTGAAFTPVVFNLFDKWTNLKGHGVNEARRSIARGQALFNLRPISISGVSGINDEAVFGKPTTLVGTCTTCHDAPNAGNHSVVAPLNIGLVDASRRTPDMPLYTLRNKTTGEIVKVTDPGRAMIDGKWSHIGRFKGPMLRNLAPRAPYFHNGFAADLDAVVDFYEERFNLGLTKQDKADLVAFLRSL